MAEAQDDSQPAGDEIQLAPEKAVTPARTDMTVAEMRQWLRNWIANATGQSARRDQRLHADGRARPVVA